MCHATWLTGNKGTWRSCTCEKQTLLSLEPFFETNVWEEWTDVLMLSDVVELIHIIKCLESVASDYREQCQGMNVVIRDTTNRR